MCESYQIKLILIQLDAFCLIWSRLHPGKKKKRKTNNNSYLNSFVRKLLPTAWFSTLMKPVVCHQPSSQTASKIKTAAKTQLALEDTEATLLQGAPKINCYHGKPFHPQGGVFARLQLNNAHEKMWPQMSAAAADDREDGGFLKLLKTWQRIKRKAIKVFNTWVKSQTQIYTISL